MNFPIRYRVYLPVIGVVGLAACVLRTVACLTSRTPDGYFSSSALPDISVWLLVALSLFALTYALFNRSPSVRPILLSHPVHIIPSGLVAFAQVLLSVDLLSRLSDKSVSDIGQVLLVLTAMCGLLGAVYFVLCLCIKGDASASRAWFGMAASLFGALYAVCLYFDTTVPLNADGKITSQIVYLCMSLYMLFDVRLSLGRARYSVQIPVGFIAAALTAYAAFPSLITYIAQGVLVDQSLYETIYTLLFFLFLCARLYGLSHLPKDEVCVFAQAALAACEARIEETPLPTADAIDTDESAQTDVHDAAEDTAEDTDASDESATHTEEAAIEYTTVFTNDMPMPQDGTPDETDGEPATTATEEDV